MIPLVISPAVREKLTSRHEVKEDEIKECFMNSEGKYVTDDREEHKSDPPTLWFIGETHKGRELKVVFIHNNGNLYIKSAYDADEAIKRIYTELAR